MVSPASSASMVDLKGLAVGTSPVSPVAPPPAALVNETIALAYYGALCSYYQAFSGSAQASTVQSSVGGSDTSSGYSVSSSAKRRRRRRAALARSKEAQVLVSSANASVVTFTAQTVPLSVGEEGFCYLQVLEDAWQKTVKDKLGSYPEVQQLMDLDSTCLKSVDQVACYGVVRAAAGLYHVSRSGPDMSSTLAACARQVVVPKPGSVADFYSGVAVSPLLVSKCPRLSDRVGGTAVDAFVQQAYAQVGGATEEWFGVSVSRQDLNTCKCVVLANGDAALVSVRQGVLFGCLPVAATSVRALSRSTVYASICMACGLPGDRGCDCRSQRRLGFRFYLPRRLQGAYVGDLESYPSLRTWNLFSLVWSTLTEFTRCDPDRDMSFSGYMRNVIGASRTVVTG